MKILTKNSTCFVGLLLLMVVGCQSPQGDRSVESVTEDIMEYEMPEREPLVFERTKGEREKDTVSFEISEPSTVKMKVSVPGGRGNIRINQLVMPNGEMDGPFGKTYAERFDEVGIYQVIIGSSMMAEDPYAGEYRLEIDIAPL